jgi:acyl carrier protein
MFERLCRVVACTLGLAPETVGLQTSMENCAAWDSLRHFEVILAVEAEFGARFSMDAIPELTSLSAILESLPAAMQSQAA